jgi:hypothetical protein
VRCDLCLGLGLDGSPSTGIGIMPSLIRLIADTVLDDDRDDLDYDFDTTTPMLA